MLKLNQWIRQHMALDVWIVIPFLLLSFFSIVMVYSASSYFALINTGNSEFFLIKQLTFFFMGLLLIGAVLLLGKFILHREWAIWSLFGLLCILLIAVLFFTGVNGARSWIDLGFFNLQPSEFAKILLIWASAYFYDKERANPSGLAYMAKPGLVFLAFILLIGLQPDLGTMMILAGVWVITLFATGYFKYSLQGLGGTAFLALTIPLLPMAFFQALPLKTYQLGRFLTYKDPWADTSNLGYQSIQGFTALARGGLTGTGLASSLQKTGFLPEAHTDFILAIVGEELGYVTILIVLAILFLLILAIYFKGANCHKLFAKYICLGVASLLLIQTCVNIGALTGLLPITGVPLPFISYGGSSYLSNSIAIGLVLYALQWDKQEAQKNKKLTSEEEIL